MEATGKEEFEIDLSYFDEVNQRTMRDLVSLKDKYGEVNRERDAKLAIYRELKEEKRRYLLLPLVSD